MEVFKGCVIYNNYSPIVFGNTERGDFNRRGKFIKESWPKSKKKLQNNPSNPYANPMIRKTSTQNTSREMGRDDRSEKSPGLNKGCFLSDQNRKKRPITAQIERIHTITETYYTSSNDINMNLSQLKGLLRQKKLMNVKLKSDYMALSKNFQGTERIWSNINNFSESAFITRKRGEEVYKQSNNTDEQIKKLEHKKEYLQNLIVKEERRIKILKEDFNESHKEMLALKKVNQKKTEELRLYTKLKSTARHKLNLAELYEQDLDYRSNIQKKVKNKMTLH